MFVTAAWFTCMDIRCCSEGAGGVSAHQPPAQAHRLCRINIIGMGEAKAYIRIQDPAAKIIHQTLGEMPDIMIIGGPPRR